MAADFAEGLIDWGANKFILTPALQVLVNDGDLTLSEDTTIEQAADKLLNAIIEMSGKKVTPHPPAPS